MKALYKQKVPARLVREAEANRQAEVRAAKKAEADLNKAEQQRQRESLQDDLGSWYDLGDKLRDIEQYHSFNEYVDFGRNQPQSEEPGAIHFQEVQLWLPGPPRAACDDLRSRGRGVHR